MVQIEGTNASFPREPLRHLDIGNDNTARETKKFPLVSIVVLNWNGERVIRLSLDSIRKLDYRNVEVIVVDNGSTDASIDIIGNEFPDFRLIKNSKNLGFSAGMNIGIKESNGDLILIYNNDAIAHPTSLSKMVKTILSNDKIGIVGGLILYYGPNDVIGSLGGKIDTVTGIIWAEGHGQKLATKCQLEEKLITDLDYVSGCVLLVRKEVIKKIGLFDEEVLSWTAQDLDWCFKARRTGFVCVLNPTAIIWHIGSFSSRRMPLRSYSEKLRTDFQVIMLHFPVIPMFSALFFQLAIAPFLELLFFRQSDITSRLRLQARVNMFCENLNNVSKFVSKREQNSFLGVLRLKPRIIELVKFAFFRIRCKEFFLGKLLQRLDS